MKRKYGYEKTQFAKLKRNYEEKIYMGRENC